MRVCLYARTHAGCAHVRRAHVRRTHARRGAQARTGSRDPDRPPRTGKRAKKLWRSETGMANNVEKQLKRLSRRELLEMMLEMSRRIDDLKKENERLKEELESKNILIENSGSLAEAAMRITGVFEAAQQAADIYLENVKRSADAQATAGAVPGAADEKEAAAEEPDAEETTAEEAGAEKAVTAEDEANDGTPAEAEADGGATQKTEDGEQN